MWIIMSTDEPKFRKVFKMNSQWKLAVLVALKLVLFGRISSNRICTCFPDVKYEDIENLNATCGLRDNCKSERPTEDLDSYNCRCDSFCAQLDTCCVDSIYRTNNPILKNKFQCKEVYGDGQRNVFMIDSCKSSWFGDATVRELCNSNGEELDDPLLIVPVTNPKTKITYKNYFCYVCNDDSAEREPVFWNLKLKSKSEEVLSSSVPELHYNSAYEAWVIGNETKDADDSFVSLTVVMPDSLASMVYPCLQDVISDCAWNWFDPLVRRKCHAYMAVARFNKEDGTVLYRNSHCSICNYENLEDMKCSADIKQIVKAFGVPSSSFFVGLFSLHDKTKTCEENMLYDSFAKKCRVVHKG